MGSDSSFSVVKSSLYSGVAVPGDVMASYWKLAVTRKDSGLMALIASHSDTSVDLYDKILARPEIAVRASFLSRVDLPRKKFEELILGEERSSVLAQVVSQSKISFSKKINGFFIKFLGEKPTKVLAEALLKSDNVSEDCHFEALRALVKLPNTDVSTELFVERLAGVVKAEDKSLKLLSECSSSFGEQVAATLLSSHDISNDVRVVALDKSLGKWAMGNSADSNISPTVVRFSLLGLLRNEGLSDEIIDLVDHYANTGSNNIVVAAIKNTDYLNYKNKVSTLKDFVSNCENAVTDDDVMSVLGSGFEKSGLEILYRKDGISATTRCAVVTAYASVDEDNCYKFLKSQGGISDEIALAFYSIAPHFTREDGFSLFSDKLEGIKLCFKLEGDPNREVSFFNHWVLLESAVLGAEVGDPLFGEIPWSFVEEISSDGWRWGSGEGRDVAVKVFDNLVRLQGEEFTDDKSWEGFLVLAEGFKGTIKELLYTCKVI